jgi:hypothetical protein
MLPQRRLPAEAAAKQAAADSMDIDELADDEEYHPRGSRPASSRGRKRTSSGRGSGAAAAAAAAELGAPPHKAGRHSGSSNGGNGTDATDSADQVALLSAANGYENHASGYDAAAAMFGLGSSGDLDAAAGDMEAEAAEAAGGRGGGSRGGSQGTAASRQEKLKEKNRLAQRRFRARQKSQLEQMQARMDELSEEVRRGEGHRATGNGQAGNTGECGCCCWWDRVTCVQKTRRQGGAGAGAAPVIQLLDSLPGAASKSLHCHTQ